MLDPKKLKHLRIPVQEIKSATNNFDEQNKIGGGGFGKVYKAQLCHFDVHNLNGEGKLHEPTKKSSTVAVKRLDSTGLQGQQEFLTEIAMLSDYRHNNLVTLLGFCDEGNEMILVYELAVNGSLDGYLRRISCKPSLTWAQRLRICLGAACGLEYLHEGLGNNHRIIHCDIKSANILLDHNFVAKISDFGLSKVGLANQQVTFVPCYAAGTPPYLDPKFMETNILTKKSDVYSFGVVLFEVFCGCLAFEAKNDEKLFLGNLAKLRYEQGRLNEIMDPELKKAISSSVLDNGIKLESLNTFSKIAYRCLQENPNERPTMAEVVAELDKALKHQLVEGSGVLRISLEEIKFATNYFDEKNLIGRGVSGRVYKGEITCFNFKDRSTTVAIKRLYLRSGQGDFEFMAQVAFLLNYSHKNIIPLLGFCDEEGERILVYDFASYGSLDKHLLNPCSLTWRQRLKICVDVAYGLRYLHNGVELQYRAIHGDVKSSNILLSHEWEASINQGFTFLTKDPGYEFGYTDPEYLITGYLTQGSDIYSFGTVLYEILCGRLAVADVIDEKKFLTTLARRYFEGKRLDEIVDQNIIQHISPVSLHIFSKIAYECTEKERGKRPTLDLVVKELEKALEFQENYEWGQKLPKDYEDIFKISQSPAIYSTFTNKVLYELLAEGILLDKGKWFSLSKEGVSCEMVSATTFSYQDRRKTKWKAIPKSRFPKVAKVLDLSNLNLKIHIRTQFLRQGITYAAYLVFKFCDKKKITTAPIYVELRYKVGKERDSSLTYFAEWRDSGWMAISLYHFTAQETCADFEVFLESFSRYRCGRGAIYIEGIEFLPVENVGHEEAKTLKDEYNVESLLKPSLDIESQSIIKGAKDDLSCTNNQELFFLLSEGILINKSEKSFYVSKLNGKKCHMLPATTVLCDSSNIKRFKWIPLSEPRFQDAIEILLYHEFCIESNIEIQMLSPNTAYACYLVYKLSEKCHGLKFPVKARNLLPGKRKETITTYLRSPSPVNALRSIRLPVKRQDGWMEVIIWEFSSEMAHDNENLPVHMKLISLGKHVWPCFKGL